MNRYNIIKCVCNIYIYYSKYGLELIYYFSTIYIITTIFIYYYEHSYIFSNIYKSINIIKKTYLLLSYSDKYDIKKTNHINKNGLYYIKY